MDQNETINSYINEVKSALEENNLVQIERNLQQLMKSYVEISDRDQFDDQVLKEIASLFADVASNYYFKNFFELSEKHYEKALRIYLRYVDLSIGVETSIDKDNLIRCYWGIGNCRSALEDYLAAIKYYKKSLKINDLICSIDQNPVYILNHINLHSNLGRVYFELQDYDTSIQYFNKAIANIPHMLFEDPNRDYNENNIYYCYFQLGKVYELKKDYEKSEYYYSLYNENAS